jgi:GYF domain 2
MEFYILKKRPHLGPFSITQLDEQLQEETITGEDLYWHAGMETWLPLSQFPGYIPPPASPPPPPAYIVRTVPITVATVPIKVAADPIPVAAEPVNEDHISTARIRKDEIRPFASAGPSRTKKFSTTKLRKDEKRPPASIKSSPPSPAPAAGLRTVTRGLIFGVAFFVVVSAGYLLTRHHSDKPEKSTVIPPRKIATVEDALRFTYGTWTYTGTERGAPGKSTLWEKLVVRPNGKIDTYGAFSSDQSWGTPTTEEYKIVSGKYTDTGERVFAIQVAAYDMKIILTNRGTLREIKADRDVEFTRGDRFPFPK